MVHPGATTWQFTPHLIVVSGLVAIGLLVLAFRAFRRTRDRSMLFISAAFGVFAAKNLVLGYAMYQNLWPPSVVGIADVVADLTTILLFVVPIFLPRS